MAAQWLRAMTSPWARDAPSVQDIPGKNNGSGDRWGTPKVNKKGEMKTTTKLVKVREGVFNIARGKTPQSSSLSDR
jgi:hypothetical protein